MRTHGNTVGSVICLAVVPVDSVLANNKGCTNGGGIQMSMRRGGKDVVNVIHCRDDRNKVWDATREKQSCVFEYLANAFSKQELKVTEKIPLRHP